MPVLASPPHSRSTFAPQLGYKLMRKGVKVAAADTILTPR